MKEELMNKPVQNIVGLCQDDILAKSRDALTKTYEQHLKAINDLCLAAKKAMTEAVASEDFDALERYKTSKKPERMQNNSKP
jgi:hypothetical protein